jgi:hypothetical protein
MTRHHLHTRKRWRGWSRNSAPSSKSAKTKTADTTGTRNPPATGSSPGPAKAYESKYWYVQDLNWLRGHMPGHMSVVVRAAEVTYFLAADATYNEALLKQRIVDGPSANLKTSLDTVARIAAFARQEPTVMLPGARLAGRTPPHRRRCAALHHGCLPEAAYPAAVPGRPGRAG